MRLRPGPCARVLRRLSFEASGILGSGLPVGEGTGGASAARERSGSGCGLPGGHAEVIGDHDGHEYQVSADEGPDQVADQP